MCFEIHDGILKKYNGSDAVVTVPEGVTTIDAYAFRSNLEIERLILPDSLIHIKMFAFCGCYYMKSVSLPFGLRYIDRDAFFKCYSLKRVIVPDSVTEIGARAFGYERIQLKLEGFTIYGVEGTAAQRYAKDNGFLFYVVNDG